MPIALASLEVLIVDCQATGAHPGGHLLEVGWARTRATESEDPEVEAHVVVPTAPLRLTPRVRRLTGLTTRELTRARPRGQVRARLRSVVEDLVATGPAQLCVAVAHFSRFEEPFVRDLVAGGDGLPLEWICTHEIARRLLPTLPRRGLRAVAGYLGEAVSELRRAPHHVRATVLIWRELVALLARERGIQTLEDLRAWCADAPPPRGRRAYPLDPEIRRRLPDRPGVYRFRRAGGSVLYVGKATSLRRRVNGYFQTSRGHHDRTLEMLAQARDVDFTPTASALEAALLEADEVKRLEPPYNVALRERDRRLAYWSWSLRRVALRADERHPVGPFVLQAPRPPLSALLELLDARGAAPAVERLGPSALGVPRRYAPPLACVQAGLVAFTRRHGRVLCGCLTPVSSRRLALLLRGVPAGPPGSPPADEDEPAPPRERWTPESVADALEEVVRRGAHAVRRARWLCALSESSVAWSRGAQVPGPRTCLVLSGGRVVARREVDAGRELPLSPGHDTPRAERQQAFDLATYDRLSAVSRELKRLVTVDPEVELRLGPDRRLDRDALEAALRWL